MIRADEADRPPLPVGEQFAYAAAFSRNLGWLTEYEQLALRHKRIAIAGMGGVGGSHLMTLARFGIGRFNIADPDRFDLVNFNRQFGATLGSIGRLKTSVMAERAREVNPELDILCLEEGLSETNLDQFLDGADVCVDGLDFFALDIRRKLNARCRESGIPVINAAPLGMGTAYLIFQPDGMSFEEWFQLDGLTEEHQYVSYLVGIAPSGFHRGYLVDSSRVDLRGHRGPSTVAGCELCAGVASVEAVKLLLRRGPVRAVPYYHQFDAYRGRWVVRKLRGGNRHPLQRIKIAVTRRLVSRLSQTAAADTPSVPPKSEVEEILEIARWAPSGDNTQPWRFQIVGDDRLMLHLTSQSDDLYDYRDGEPTLLSGGMLLESIRIAATRFGRGMEWRYLRGQGRTHEIEVHLPPGPEISVDPLLSFVPLRSVDRRPYRLQPLTAEQKTALGCALGTDLSIEWHERLSDRWAMARLGAKATAIRLRTPEAFPIHQRVVDWNHQYSPIGIPAPATGMSGPSLSLMRWAMRSWSRMRLLNLFGGVFAGATQMDYAPGIFSGAFFSLRGTPKSVAEPGRSMLLLKQGQAIQRFWLTAVGLGLAIQPAMAILIFADYGRRKESFTRAAGAQRRAAALAGAVHRMQPEPEGEPMFIGRIGTPRPNKPACRSVRLPISSLLRPKAFDPGRDSIAASFGEPRRDAEVGHRS